MAQINLLKQNSKNSNIVDIFWSSIVKALVLVVLGIVVFYGTLYFKIKKTTENVSELEQSIQVANKDIGSVQGKEELVTRQAQLKELGIILSKHQYWSQFIPEIAKVTLKSANYVSLEAMSDGSLTLILVVPDMTELDKFLQVFDSPSLNKNFSDLRLGAIGTVQREGKIAYQVQVRIKYNTELLKYNSAISGQ